MTSVLPLAPWLTTCMILAASQSSASSKMQRQGGSLRDKVSCYGMTSQRDPSSRVQGSLVHESLHRIHARHFYSSRCHRCLWTATGKPGPDIISLSPVGGNVMPGQSISTAPPALSLESARWFCSCRWSHARSSECAVKPFIHASPIDARQSLWTSGSEVNHSLRADSSSKITSRRHRCRRQPR
jgi:hypothetical protein